MTEKTKKIHIEETGKAASPPVAGLWPAVEHIRNARPTPDTIDQRVGARSSTGFRDQHEQSLSLVFLRLSGGSAADHASPS
ncbi:hypothetical protein [Aminivibrio sp.]|uniref:hypothetical protein n=1 Tax=Aminivibrio sp. TaxID=1872489 RepID=UPI003D95CEB8